MWELAVGESGGVTGMGQASSGGHKRDAMGWSSSVPLGGGSWRCPWPLGQLQQLYFPTSRELLWQLRGI